MNFEKQPNFEKKSFKEKIIKKAKQAAFVGTTFCAVAGSMKEAKGGEFELPQLEADKLTLELKKVNLPETGEFIKELTENELERQGIGSEEITKIMEAPAQEDSELLPAKKG